jgi:hypothetical protein
LKAPTPKPYSAISADNGLNIINEAWAKAPFGTDFVMFIADADRR